MKKVERIHRVYLVNSQTLGARCGYGEGQSHQEARENALRIARERDPDAYFGADGQVWFRGGVNC